MKLFSKIKLFQFPCMNFKKSFFFLSGASIALVFVFFACNNQVKEEFPLFELLDSSMTNVNFSNSIEESPLSNIMTYQYFYNGGGVAVGDVNKDGLQDLFFTGNMSPNKLYLNKGNLMFQDITLATGTGGREENWTTGAVMVDINGDGLMDIYVCYSGNHAPENRKNQLFVNQGLDAQGIPYFKEMAKNYGLDDSGYSTSAVFFDFDLDGDLDVLLLQHNPELYSNLDESNFKKRLQEYNPDMSTKLLRNEQGKFTDVSQASGLIGSPLSYGLGAGVSDINGDGFPDIYIANDYSAPDYFYMNNGDGTFSERSKESLGHTSLYSMGMELSDFDNDGLVDIFTLDMLPEDNKRQKLLFSPENYDHFNLLVNVGLHHQYMRNMLQRNNGDGTFSEIGQLAGISNTDWSWTPLFADFNNSGRKDLFVSNGFVKDFTNLDFINNRNEYLKNQKVTQNGIIGLINSMPATPLQNYIFENLENHTFINKALHWGLDQLSNSNGAVYVDLDNDGDLELVVNNINQNAFIYKNNSRENLNTSFLQVELQGEKDNILGLGAKVTLYSSGELQFQEQNFYKGFQGNVSPVLHFGLGEWGRVDSLKITWPRGESQSVIQPAINTRHRLLVSDAKNIKEPQTIVAPIYSQTTISRPNFHSNTLFNDFKRQGQLMGNLSNTGPAMIKEDVNGDGLEDIFIGGGMGQKGQLLLQNTAGDFEEFEGAFEEYEEPAVDVNAIFLDANQDGFPDLYIVRGGYHDFQKGDALFQDQLYLNDGKGRFKKINASLLPDIRRATAFAVALDINQDGLMDLFVGGGYSPGKFPETEESYLLLNTIEEGFVPIFSNEMEVLKGLTRVTGAAAMDLDGDGVEELIVVGEWSDIQVFKMVKGELSEATASFFDAEYRGLWSSMLLEDLDGDGTPELIVGNFGLNSQYQASQKEPLEMHFADFDENGSVDPLLTFFIGGVRYPYLSRDELAGQMYRKKAIFPTYKEYAEAKLENILSKEELSKAETLSVTTLETMLFSLVDGKFKAIPLPIEAQYAPVEAIAAVSNKDSNMMDLILAGNKLQTRLRIGRLDANHGIYLQSGSTIQQYVYIPQHRSGLNLNGDVKSILKIQDRIWFGIHNAAVVVYQKK